MFASLETSVVVAREASEEANAKISINSLLAIYTIRRLSMVQLIYCGVLQNEDISAGHETQEVGLFSTESIPWEKLAFPSVSWAISQYSEIKEKGFFTPFQNPNGQEGDYILG